MGVLSSSKQFEVAATVLAHPNKDGWMGGWLVGWLVGWIVCWLMNLKLRWLFAIAKMCNKLNQRS
jgi:hypothetical protein